MNENYEKMEDDLYEKIMERYDTLCKEYTPVINLANDSLGLISYGSVDEYDKGEPYIESIEEDYITIISDISFMGNNLNNFCECILEEVSSRNKFEKTFPVADEGYEELTYTMTTKPQIIIHMIPGNENDFRKSLTLSIHVS